MSSRRMRRAALSKMRTGAGAFSSEHDEVHEDETDETAELTAREIVNATEILNLKWKEDAGFQLPGRGAYSKDSERTQRHHRQLNREAATGSKKMTDFFSPKENIGFLFEWEVGRKMTGKKPRSKHIHAEKKAFHWPHIPSSLFSSYKGESESCGGIQINAGERSGEVV